MHKKVVISCDIFVRLKLFNFFDMEKKVNILQEDFTPQAIVVPGYEAFMQGLMDIVHSGPVCNHLGEKVKTYVLNFVKKQPLDSFNRFSGETYVRNYIGRDADTHWEAIVMCWKKGNQTAIHSHPQFASYTFVDGEFLVEVFEPCEKGIKLAYKTVVNDIRGLYAIGEAGKFDNHIHRITCLSDTARSLHVYSDDALKGKKLIMADSSPS